MRPAYPPDSKQEFPEEQEYFNESPLRGDDDSDDDHSEGVTSLLEEKCPAACACGQADRSRTQSVADQR